LDYEFSRLSSTTLDGGESLEFAYTSGQYFDFLYSKISETSPPVGTIVLNRKAVNIEYIITAGAQDFADFLKVSAPSTSVAQDKPAYSNIDGGGFGIFSCRSTFRAPKTLANATVDHMATKKPLCDLLFLNSFGNPGSTCN
jgi:hypothetical protein